MLRTIQVVLSANVAGFAAGMGTASAAVKQFGNEANQMATRTDTASKQTIQTVGRLSLAVGAGLAVAFGLSIKAAADFQVELRNVATISEYTRQNFAKVGDSLLDMSRQFPQSASEMAKGMYDIASSGFDGAEAMTVLRASAFAASAGLTNTATAAKGITAVLNAYGLSGFKAAEVSDILFQTVNLGVLSFEELSSSLGDFVGSAAAAGVPIEDASAALATMTLSGISAAESSTSLNRVLQSLIDPSEAMTAALKAQGYESGMAAVQALGLKGTMDLLRTTTGGNIEELVKLFPEIRAARGALALMANEGENYNRVAAGITDETERLGATQRAYNEQSKTFSFQLELAKNNVAALGIELGTMLLPALTEMLALTTGVVGALGEMPEPVKYLVLAMGALVTMAALVGGAFLLLAPKIVAAQAAMVAMNTSAPMMAGALRAIPGVLGAVGLALGVSVVALAVYGKEKQEAKARTDEFVTAIEAEKEGLKGEVDAVIAAQLAKAGLIDTAMKLGVSLDLVTRAAGGDEAAMKSLIDIVGMGSAEALFFVGRVNEIAVALGKATGEVRQNEAAQAALHPAQAKTSAQLKELEQKFGIVEGSTGAATDKFSELGSELGITGQAMRRLALDSESAAKMIHKAVTGAMDATRSAFVSDLDVVAQFSRSSWESMSSDAEDGSSSISSSADKVADAEQNLIYTQERLAERTAEAYASMQEDVERAADGIIASEERLADSKRELIELQERQAESNASEEEKLANDVERANEKVLNSEERILDARQNLADLQERQSQKDELTVSDRQALERAEKAVTRATDDLTKAQKEQADAQAAQSAGAQQSVSERQQLERANRNIVESEKALAEAHEEQAAAQAKLSEGVKLSVSDHQELERAQRAIIEAQDGMTESGGRATVQVGTMAEEVEKFFTNSAAEAKAFLSNINEAIERGLDPEYVSQLLQQGPREAGPLLEMIIGDHSGRMIGMANEFMETTGAINAQAVEMARLTSLAVSSHSDQMGKDLKNAMRIAQLQAASGGKLTAEALSRELGIGMADVKRILESFGIDAPASMSAAGTSMIGSWASALSTWPGETRAKADATSKALTDVLGTLPQWVNTAGEMTKEEWLAKLEAAGAGTGEKAQAWAEALAAGLNPILIGVGAPAIVVRGATRAAEQGRANSFAAGGIVERHDPQVAVGGPMRIWNEPELPWEGYVSGDPAKKGRSVAVMHELAKRLGLQIFERAEGGIDEFGLAMPPSLASAFGSMMGGTTDASTGHTYEAARAWMAARGGRVGGTMGGAAPSGPAPPGTVTDWVRASANIVGVGESWVAPGYRRAMYESSGNPLAENRWDSNWEAGIPSRGLWQTIQPTFDHYMLPGHGDIWNPIDNGIAAMRYILDVYGSIFAIDPPTSGYRAGGIVDYALMDRGGTLKPGLTLVQNNTGRNEMVAGPGQSVVNTGEMSSATSHTGTQGSASSTMNVTSVNGAPGSYGGRPAGLDMGVGHSATSVDNSSHLSLSMPIDVQAHIAPGMDTGAIRTAVRAAVGTAQDEMLRQLLALLRMHGRRR